MAEAPRSSERVPIDVPFNCTEAPAIGSSFSSVILPLTETAVFCARAFSATNKDNKKTKQAKTFKIIFLGKTCHTRRQHVKQTINMGLGCDKKRTKKRALPC